MDPTENYLRRTDVIDWDHPAVMEQACALAVGCEDTAAVAKACFEWVRDEVMHSRDFERNPVTWRASDVLLHRTGYCYAKSHLLAALLRANGIPAGFCYQRLSVGDAGPPFCLHGFNAIELPGVGWYRVDPRGNRAGIDAQFTPPIERLAFALQSAEEVEFANVLAEPLACVVNSLERYETWDEMLANLPDVEPDDVAQLTLIAREA
ncbi:transglutaminase-like domain-containing protein [Lacipirellula sp.]|uniref:transglutaminase-like domain-containing protein n=1 Tax=Lacipirellula sp. TaxID=2691419 RepID=UPI003D14FCBF